MSSLDQNITKASKHLRPVHWSDARQGEVRAAIFRRRRRFTLSAVALGSAAMAVVVAVAIVWFAQGTSTPSRGTVAELAPVPAVNANANANANAIELGDGTRAVELGSGSAVRLLREDESVVSFALDSGKGWFEVTPSRTRRVEVHIRDVHVEVLGTEFVVEVRGDYVHVWVHRGKVSVESDGDTVVLRKGENGTFLSEPKTLAPPPIEAVDAGVPDVPIDAGRVRSKLDLTEKVNPKPSPKPRAILVSDEKPAAMTVEELWNVADAARKKGRGAAAVKALSKLLNDHPDDARAALAAFSLGRVLLDTGHSAEVAARAFAKARKLSPDGPLVEDALLREVEAWHTAGDTRRVRSRIKKYLRQFPDGRYKKQLRDLGATP